MNRAGPARLPTWAPARRTVLGAVLGFFICATSTPARAFCRSLTCAADCREDPLTGCLVGGDPIAWARSCVSYTLQWEGSSSISNEQLRAATDAAFAAWQEVKCLGDAPPSINAYNLFGVTSCSRVEFNARQANANIVVLRSEWDGSAAALALTTVSLNKQTGEIYDADIEINGTQPLSVGPIVPARYDLQSIITHEVGHFFGIAHSIVGLEQKCTDGATMCPSYIPGSDHFQTLHEDDIAAMCAVYPPERETSICDPTPHRGFSPECGMDPMSGGACSVGVAGRPAPVPGVATVFIGFGLVLRRLRRARRRCQKVT